jgi:hypothetical protein
MEGVAERSLAHVECAFWPYPMGLAEANILHESGLAQTHIQATKQMELSDFCICRALHVRTHPTKQTDRDENGTGKFLTVPITVFSECFHLLRVLFGFGVKTGRLCSVTVSKTGRLFFYSFLRLPFWFEKIQFFITFGYSVLGLPVLV